MDDKKRKYDKGANILLYEVGNIRKPAKVHGKEGHGGSVPRV